MRPRESVPWHQDLHFPKGGTDVSAAFGRQPTARMADGSYSRTTPLGLNVRVAGPDRRERGCSRPGLSRFVSTRPVGTRWVLQELATVVGAGYTPVGGFAVQGSMSGRVVTVVAVQQGQVYSAVMGATAWTQAGNQSGLNPPLIYSGIMFSAPNNQRLYFADGSNYVYLDAATNTVQRWVSTVEGVPLPVDDEGNTPRLICTWRGRTILSGLLGQPQAVFGSRKGDPGDFNISPDAGSTGVVVDAAFAMTVGNEGLVGDMVTCLIPYSDDLLVIGTDHEIHIQRGDPLDGGRRDLVTGITGMAWGQPWCQDPSGRIWFMSSRTGLYTLVPGQLPERVSRQIDPLLQEIDTGTNSIRLAWDDRYQCVEVFVTPLQAPLPTTHYTYEVPSGAWFTREFANSGHNPLCVAVADGNEPGDRVVLLGCWDGYVRKIDPEAEDDDGVPIESEVWIGPLVTPEMDELRVDQIQAVMGEGSGDVDCTIHVGTTAELALEDGGREVGTFGAGKSPTFPVRVAGHAVYLRLKSVVRWSMEQIRLRMAPLGGVRRRSR